jgi:hypothetical protein
VRFIDGVYLIRPPSGIGRRAAKELAKELQELCNKYELKVLVAKAPPLLRAGEPFYCKRCKERIIVGETRSSLTGVPECPFCGNTDRVQSLTE